MGRKPKGIILGARQEKELQRRLTASHNRWEKERILTILEAAQCEFSLEELARRNQRTRSTIQNWLAKYNEGGISELLSRQRSRGGISPFASDLIQKEFRQGVIDKRWHSAVDVARWLKNEHGITRSHKSIYYWLTKNGFGWRVLRERTATDIT